MNRQSITVEEILAQQELLKIDVRTFTEHANGSIPDSVNCPIFNEEERSKIGTVYKQISKDQAILLGYDLVNPKLERLYQEIKAYTLKTTKCVVLYCWRGGMRSQSLVDYCRNRGLPVFFLEGGYKAYRKKVYGYLTDPDKLMNLIVLTGATGVGKTRILSLLAQRGEPIIDLEKEANNRGSVFGQIHGGSQPSQKDFEASLYQRLSEIKQGYAFVECESKRIGRLYLPATVYQKMQSGRRIHLYADRDQRIERLVDDYSHYPEQRLIRSVGYLTKTLGEEKVNLVIDWILHGEYAKAADYLLTYYYDPLYGFPIGKTSKYELSIDCNDLTRAVDRISRYLHEEYGMETRRL